MARPKGSFYQVILDADPPSHSQYEIAVERVKKSPSEVAIDEETELELFLDFATTAVRLNRFFGILTHHQISNNVADEIILNLLLPILHADDDQAHPAMVTQIIISSVPILMRPATKRLDGLIKAIFATSNIMERMIADAKGALVVKDWLNNREDLFQDPLLLRSFMDRLMKLCESCTHDHKTGFLSKRWAELLQLTTLLESLNLELERTQAAHAQGFHRTAMASSLKRLDESDKKTMKSQDSRSLIFPTISPEISTALGSFGISLPRSSRSLQIAIDRLMLEETFSLLKVAAETFPCRPCNEALASPAKDIDITKGDDANLAKPPFKSTLDSSFFGRRVGNWKVLLSAQAIKDVVGANHADIFDIIKIKLVELASGTWKGKNLSVRAGSVSQMKQMKVPILRVNCTEQLMILWQIDIGTYDDLDSVKQLVKVWRIVGPDKMNTAITQIIILQSSYGFELIQQCTRKPVMHLKHTYIPTEFEPVKHSTSPIRFGGDQDTAEMEHFLMEMSNRYYNVTEPLLKSLFLEDVTSRYPFELSQEELRIVSHTKTPTLILGRSGTGKTTCLVFKILASYQLHTCPPGESSFRQVLLTRSPYLAAKLKNYIRTLFQAQAQQDSPHDVVAEEKLLQTPADTLDDTETIVTLQEEPLPLICTLEQFLTMIENHLKVSNRGYFFDSRQNQPDARVLDFYTFRSEYWCRFPLTITKLFEVDLVFAEIMGVIKGSIASADTLRSLSLEQYLSTSERSAPTFTTELERTQIYDIYERYEKFKSDQGDIDQADRVANLLREMKTTPGLSNTLQQAFQELYIDEVQDLRGIDIALLVSIIKDPRCIHLAGDTAQCISKDSTFRFAEIKDLFHERYALTGKSINKWDRAHPTQFALSKNYRSHQGILDLASMVMKLLWNGFPDTVDKLEPEFGQLYGPKPLLYAGFDAQILSSSMIGLVKLDDRLNDFGAEQVILVRDDEAKGTLQAEIGDITLVLTILESKGMEFDDVLLYNFFSDGGHTSSYRVLYLLLDHRKVFFDAKKHAVLCSELKHFYVAITRARKQLWLLESSAETTTGILHVLEHSAKEPLVEVVKPTDRKVLEKVKILRAGKSVDIRRWVDRGHQFLQRKNFSDALLCFKKGHDERNTKVAMAFLSEQEARTCKANGDHEGFMKGSQEAINLFLQVQLVMNASNCLESIGEYDRAGRLWHDRMEYLKAADIYQRGGLFEKASNCHHLSGNFDKAAEALRVGDLFDKLIIYLSQNRDCIEPASRRRYGRLCNLLLNQGRVSPDLWALCIDLLGSDETKEQFLKEFHMTSQLADLYKSQGRNVDLYHLLIEDGQVESAFNIATSNNLYGIIGEDELEYLFNFVVAGKTLWGKENELHPSWLALDWEHNAPHSLLAASAAWDSIAPVLVQIKKGDLFIQLSDIKHKTIRDCVCIYIASFLESFIEKTPSISQLPVEVLKEVVAFVQMLTPGKGAASEKSIFLGFGIFTAPSKKQVILPWSPISAIEPVTAAMHEVALRWLLNSLSSTTAAFNEKARALSLQESPEPCVYFLLQNCNKVGPNMCRFSHREITTEICLSDIIEVVRITSVFSHMTRLYYCRVMNEEFQQSFLPNRRYWMERLIRAVTYVSALDQDSMAVMEAISLLRHHQSYSSVVYSLEDLIFYKISSAKDAHKLRSVSSALTEYHLSFALGPEVNGRFVRAMKRKVYYPAIALHDRDGGDIFTALDTIDAFGNIQAAILSNDIRRFDFYFTKFLTSFKRTNIHGLMEFHAVVVSYEFIATYLLYVRNPHEPIVIPQSWVLHLSPVLRNMAPNLPGIQTFRLMQWIRELVFSFCDLLDRIARAPRNDFSFHFGTRALHKNIIMGRNIVLLAVIFLNLECVRYPAREAQEIMEKIQKTFLVIPPVFRFIHHRRFENFMQEFVLHYKMYKGKDQLVVVKPNGECRYPTMIRKVLDLGASEWSLEKVISSNKLDETCNRPSHDATHIRPLGDEETEAITKILHFWRQYWPRKREARKFSLTPQAQIIASYHNLYAVCAPADHPIKSKVAVRALFVTKGLKLQTQLVQMSDILHATEKVLSDLLTDVSIPTSQLEDLQESWSSFQRHKSDVEKIKSFWSTKDALRSQLWWLEPRTLETNLQRDLKAMKIIQKEVEGLRSELG